MTTPGVDYSYGRPGGKALAEAGMTFAARYLSHTAGKNLSRAEADDLAAHGVSCVVVWETTAQRASEGAAAGIADARDAVKQAAMVGMPSSRPIYFAVDYDAAPSAVVAYFRGVASVLGLSRTGVYGGYRVVSYLLDHGFARWAWQTAAWSGGRWDARAHIRQYATTVKVGGVVCDKNTALVADFGQWTPGRTPDLEDDMALTRDETYDAVLRTDRVPAPADAPDRDTNPTWTLESCVRDLQVRVRAIQAAQATQAAPEIDYAKLAAALIAAVATSHPTP